MKKVMGVVLVLSILAGAAVVPGAFAAVIVHDPKNTAENHATYLKTAQTTLNTSTQVANQVTNLASVSPEAMLAYILGFEEEFKNMAETMKEAQGLMKAAQTAQTAWNSTFRQVDTFFDGNTSNVSKINNLADSQKMIAALDRTYEDSLRVAKATENIEKDAKRLRELMEQNKNAVGNKQAIQTQNNLVAQQNVLMIKQNQALGAVASTIIAHFAKKNQEDAYATAVNQKYKEEGKKVIASDAALRKQYGVE